MNPEIAEYCRELEAHLCRKNDGHLIRIAGPSFEIVSRWASDGVPLKVAMSGIDRYFERYYRKGPRRRPIKIDFCEADVLDAFDDWRRATGLSRAETQPGADDEPERATRRRGPSLPEHLNRVLVRLSSLRATGVLPDEADPHIDAVSAELDTARHRPGGLRGDERRAALDRLARLDAELLATVVRSAGSDTLRAVEAEAVRDLAPFRATMGESAFAQVLQLARDRVLRERLGLPVISLI